MKAYPFVIRLSSFTGRAVVFFLLSSLLLVYLYVLGSTQGFLDSTQFLILRALRLTLLLEIASGLYLFVLLLVRTIRERRTFALRLILLLFSIALCTVLLVTLRFLQSWLRA
jgi:hypothetical protein